MYARNMDFYDSPDSGLFMAMPRTTHWRMHIHASQHSEGNSHGKERKSQDRRHHYEQLSIPMLISQQFRNKEKEYRTKINQLKTNKKKHSFQKKIKEIKLIKNCVRILLMAISKTSCENCRDSKGKCA